MSHPRRRRVRCWSARIEEWEVGMSSWPECLPGLGGAADLVVAGAAIDRTVTARDEGDFSHDAALGAGGRVHLSRRLAAKAGENTIADVAFFRLKRLGRAPGRPAAR